MKKYLVDLENRIDEKMEEKIFKQWVDFSAGKFQGDIFSPKRVKKVPAQIEWPEIRINEALNDYNKMALQQLKGCSSILAKGSGNIMAVRCNYGTSIIPSLFGVEIFVMEDKLNTLPTSKPIEGGKEKIKELIKKGVPDIYSGLGTKVFTMAEHFLDIQQKFPKIGKHVYLYHPDLQGPMDICEVIWGSNLFLDIMDEPELVKEFLDLITETYIAFMKEWIKLVPLIGDYAVHWSMLQKGQIMLRDDSAMNFSNEMFEEFIKPYDQKLLSEFGGGAIHFCGKGDHYIESVSNMDGLYAIAMSQPEYNDMEVIYKNTVDKDIKLIGFSGKEAEKALKNRRNLKSNVQC